MYLEKKLKHKMKQMTNKGIVLKIMCLLRWIDDTKSHIQNILVAVKSKQIMA